MRVIFYCQMVTTFLAVVNDLGADAVSISSSTATNTES